MSPSATTMIEKSNSQIHANLNGTNQSPHSSSINTHGKFSPTEAFVDEPLDMLGIGFGPASLAIAIALHDSVSMSNPRVLFLEKQSAFSWHAGMQIPGAHMQISFLKDLATPRNPQSKFTFINYLHTQGRLNQFINLSTFYPSRLEYEDYLRWCASHFEVQGMVNYGVEVKRIHAGRKNLQGKVSNWEVIFQDSNGRTMMQKARHVVIAVGGIPVLPKELLGLQNVTHSSQFVSTIKNLQETKKSHKLRFAVVGAGQSAAEIFNELWSRMPESDVRLIIKGENLRSCDDSPFVNEIFDPDRVDGIYAQPSENRSASLLLDRGTNYGVINPALLKNIYEKLYIQKISPKSTVIGKACILKSRTVVHARSVPNSTRIFLTLGDTMDIKHRETLEVDHVFAATGYSWDAHESLLEDIQPYLEECDSWSVKRNYQVKLDAHKVDPGAGIWLQGCNEKTHGLSDTLLSILAIRGGEIVNSIFGP
ncbi:BgTH12-00262 [Blumeria graminis f. sp. triticale]|nr:BgTH12-00262 [Blumeria graminis f. sp. triticale]